NFDSDCQFANWLGRLMTCRQGARSRSSECVCISRRRNAMNSEQVGPRNCRTVDTHNAARETTCPRGAPAAPHPPLIPPQGGLPMLPRCARSLAVRSIACVLFLAGVSWICADEPEKLPPIVAQVLKGHAETVYAVAYTPDGKQVITASFDKTLKLWDAATGKEIKTFAGPQGHQNLILCVALSPDGQLIASGSSDNQAKIWDFPGGKPLKDFAHVDAVNAVALSPDGT